LLRLSRGLANRGVADRARAEDARPHPRPLGGDQDAGAGMENVEKLRAALESAGAEHEFHIYAGLGHGFLKASLEDEKTPGYEQACASWKRTLDFYRRCFSRERVLS